jgi:hypothetical protein
MGRSKILDTSALKFGHVGEGSGVIKNSNSRKGDLP